MSSAAAAGAGAAAHAARIQAIRSLGVVVTVDAANFLEILASQEDPIVVTSQWRWFKTHYYYLTTYRGLTFYCDSYSELPLPEDAEIIAAKSLGVPV
jgi:hypothetical protein